MTRKSTRAAPGSGTIRQRPDGRWEARYTAGRDPGTGKQIQRSVYGATQKEVRQKLQRVSVDLDEGTYSAPSRLTVAQWLTTWLAEYTGNVKPYTLSSYKVQVNNHIIPALGAAKLTALDAPMIQGFYNRLQQADGDRAALSPKTIKNVHGVLHSALKQAVALGYIRANPSDSCTLPRVFRKEITPLDESDMAAFLKAIRGTPFEVLFSVDLFTGMRQGEILGLQWSCVDFERGTILVNKQLQREKKRGGKYYLAPLKNDKSRLLAPASAVMDLLQSHRKEQVQNRLAVGSKWNDGGFGDLVFTNEFGQHLVHMTVYRHFKAMADAAGVPSARFHDLRHSYAVAALRAGDDVKTVQEHLGHHTAAFTLDVYGHVTERMQKESANRMDSFIQTLI